MKDQQTPIEMLFEKAQTYGETNIELFKLNAIEKSANITSSLLSRIVIGLIIAMCIFLASLGLALYIGECAGKSYYGFFILAGCYTLIAFVISLFRHQWIKTPISNLIISKLLKQKENEKE